MTNNRRAQTSRLSAFEFVVTTSWMCDPSEPDQALTAVEVVLWANPNQSEDDEPIEVARATGYDATTSDRFPLIYMLDAHSEELSEFTGVADDEDLPSDSVAILDKVVVEPRYRGLGYGPLVAAHFVHSLPHIDVILAYPFPMELPKDSPDDIYNSELERLRLLWQRFGFTEYENSGKFRLLLPNDKVDATWRSLEHLLRDPDVPTARGDSNHMAED